MSTPVSEAESDRRLRPVLDALFSHNPKQSLKLLNQALQKRPGWPAARALRACAYLQADRFADANTEIVNLRADLDARRVPINEDAARKLHMYYMEIRREDLAAEVYEQAWRLETSNIQLAEAAFCLYIRGADFPSAQKIATRINRLVAGTTQRYALWAGAALWLRLTMAKRRGGAHDVAKVDTSANDKMSQLAIAMLGVAIDASGTPTAEMVRFGVRAFREAGEFERATKLISHPRLVMDEAEVVHLRATVATSDEIRLNDYCTLISRHDSDGWEHWMRYFDTVGRKDGWEIEAGQFVEEMIAATQKGEGSKRGPLLAQLELFCRIGNIERLSTAVANYFHVFGGKTACADDLRPYLHVIHGTGSFEACLAKMRNVADEKGHSYYLTLAWLRLWLGLLDDSAQSLYAKYEGLLDAGTKVTDRQPGDDYLILAAHRLLPDGVGSAHKRYENSSAVMQAVAILENGLSRSPFNFRIKMLLLRLYLEVGAIGRVGELWESMEIKHIQLSTLTHLVHHAFFESGHHEEFKEILNSVEGLWKECDQEIPDCITKAFQVGSINSGAEFVLFRERLARSAVLAEAAVTEALYEIVATKGEPIGLSHALACFSVLPRFSSEEILSLRTLIANDDDRCYQFWDIANYDPNSRLNCTYEEDSDQGRPCPPGRANIIAADMASLKAILLLSAPGVGSSHGVEDMRASEDLLRRFMGEDLAQEKFPETTLLRIKVALNFYDIRRFLDGLVSEGLDDDNHRLASAQQTLQTCKGLSQGLIAALTETTSRVDSCGNGIADVDRGDNKDVGHSYKGNGEVPFCPSRLRRCSRLVFDTLLLISSTTMSFSPLLPKGRKRAKKASSKENGSAQSIEKQCFENARAAVLEYKNMTLTACSLVETWITSCIAQDLDWAASVFGTEEFSHAVSFLPDRITPVELSDGEARFQEEVGREEFLDEIVAQTCASHAKTCTSMLDIVTKIVRRMKMIDL